MAVLLALLFAGAACGGDPVARLEKDGRTLAVVGRYTITLDDFSAALAYSQAGSNEDPWVRSRVWDSLIEEVLVLNDLPGEKGGGSPQPLGALSDPKSRESAVGAALQERVYSKVDIPPAEVTAYYKAHPEEFTRGPGILVREMLLPGPEQAADARALIGRGHSFVDVARLYSRSPSRGAQQYFQAGELPDYLKPVIESIPIGGVTQPLRLTENAYQILAVEGRYQSYVLPEDEVAPEVRLRLADERGEARKTQYIKGLRERFRTVAFSSKLPFEYQKETP